MGGTETRRHVLTPLPFVLTIVLRTLAIYEGLAKAVDPDFILLKVQRVL